MTGQEWFLAAMVTVQLLSVVTLPARVGQAREPITARQAAFASAISLAAAAGYLWVWTSL